MAVRGRLLISVCATFALVACRGQHASPDARDNPHVAAALEETPPSLNDAAVATYWGGQARQITLTDGAFTGPKGERVQLLRQHYVVGDLEGDGAVDAVVALSVTNAGAEDGQYIAVLRHLGTDTISLGTSRLKDAVDVRGLRVDGRRIVVDLTRPSATGAAEPAQAIYQLGRGELVEVTGDGK
jgi:hypothetical protein